MRPTRTHTPRPDGTPACGVRGDTATAPEHVDCLRCRRTAWWAATHEFMPRTLAMWPARGATVEALQALDGTDTLHHYAYALAEDVDEGLTGHDAEQHTERGDVLRWLLTHPEAPIRWRLASERTG